MEDAASTPQVDLLAEYLTDEQLAKELKKSVRTIKRWRRLRKTPAVTVVGEIPYTHVDTARDWLRNLEERG